jgi:hypothetical protein
MQRQVDVDRVPELTTDRLWLEDLTTEQCKDEGNGPLTTHQLAAISAELAEEQLEASGMKGFDEGFRRGHTSHGVLWCLIEMRGRTNS